jgi:hypothetical protein
VFSELAGGGKRIAWKDIKMRNRWYIDEAFLAPRCTFENPTRLSESDIRTYWVLWYKQSKSGHNFTFKMTTAPKEKDGDKEEGGVEERGNPQQEKDQSSPERTSEGQGPGHLTPDQCDSDEAKLSFLKTLISDHKEFQAIITILAPMSVSSYYHLHIPS